MGIFGEGLPESADLDAVLEMVELVQRVNREEVEFNIGLDSKRELPSQRAARLALVGNWGL